MKNDHILIKHILEAIEKAEQYIGDLTFEEFSQDDKTLSAVVQELTVIGEAAVHISEDFKADHPEVPLREAAGMRNRIVHAYWDIDEKTVWDTCKSDLPVLKEKLGLL